MNTIDETKKNVGAAIHVVGAVAEAIRGLGEVPSGHLYAQVCGTIELSQYEAILGILQRAGLVSRNGDLLRWVGPAIGS